MVILYVIIMILLIVVVLLVMTLLLFLKKNPYLSSVEIEYISFVIDIFIDYADDLGIQHTKEEHNKLVIALEKIKTKLIKKE